MTGKTAWTPIEIGGDVPHAKGAYSRAIRAGNLIFVSGQIPRDFVTGELIGDDVESQTRAVLENVRIVLEAAGASLADLVSVTAWLSTIDDWGRFDAVYRSILQSPYPTRTTVGAQLHGVLVEITAIASVSDQ